MNDNSVPYTLTTPAGVVVFDPVDPANMMWFEDIAFKSDVRASTQTRPQTHGSYMDPGFKDGGVVNGKLRIAAGGAKLRAYEDQLLACVNSILGSRGQGTLTWTPQGTSVQRRLSGCQLMECAPAVDGSTMTYNLQLATERPFAEDAVATVVDSAALTTGGGGFTIPLTVPFTITASSGGTVTVTNSGTFEAYPILRVYGPITVPRITNLSTGKALVFTGSIGAGDYLELDLFARTAKLNGVTPFTSIDVASSDWWSVYRGDTSLQLSGLNYSTSTLLRAYMRSSWA